MFGRAFLRLIPADRRYRGPVVIAGAWSIVAIAAAVQALALVRLDGRANVIEAVLNRVSIVPLWALATPLVLRSARRYPVVDGNGHVLPSRVLLHLVLASVFVVVTNLLIRIPVAGGIDTLVRSTMQGVAEYYPPAVVVYGVLVAIGHVLFRPSAAAQGGPEPLPASPMVVESLGSPVVDAVDAKAESLPPTAVTARDGHLTVRQWNRVHLVRVEDIDFVEAEDNYVVVHAASRTYKGRDRISDVESQLDARRFVRIHRSTIVHLAKIREVQPLTHGDHAVILRDGKVLRVARSRRQALGEALGVEL
jgi:hypothetical protein